MAEYEFRFEKHYGRWRSVIRSTVEKYLDCGNLKNGIARVGPSLGPATCVPYSSKRAQFLVGNAIFAKRTQFLENLTLGFELKRRFLDNRSRPTVQIWAIDTHPVAKMQLDGFCHKLWHATQMSGGSRIRTHEELAPLAVFKTAAFNHSAIPPDV